MANIKYQDIKFKPATLGLIETCVSILEEYRMQGYDMTLRQLYYQFVSRDLIPNKQSEYKRLGSIVNDARLAGLIDWTAIVDRTRSLRSITGWDSPEEIIGSCVSEYHLDRWPFSCIGRKYGSKKMLWLACLVASPENWTSLCSLAAATHLRAKSGQRLNA